MFRILECKLWSHSTAWQTFFGCSNMDPSRLPDVRCHLFRRSWVLLRSAAPGSFFVDSRPGRLFIFSSGQGQFHMSESVLILHALGCSKLISSALGCSNCADNTRWSLIRCTVPWGWVKQPSWLWSTWTLWRTTRPAQCVTTRICANSCPRRTDGVWFKHHGIVAVTMEVKSPPVSTKSHRVSVWQTSMQWTKQPNDYSCSWSWQFDSMPDVRC